MEQHAKREIRYLYRGVSVACCVSTVQEELSLKISACIKGRAVESGQLPSLWCEDGLVASGRATPLHGVEPSFLREAALARASCKELLPDHESGSSLAIKSLLLNKQRLLLGIDRAWRVEEYFFLSFVGPEGEERLRELTLECLPTASTPVPSEEALARLERLQVSKLFEFVSVGAQVAFSNVKAMVSNIRQRRSPTWEATATEYVETVKARLAYFCTHEEPGASGGASRSTFGREALARHFEAAEEKHSAGEEMTLAEVGIFHTFKWLLTAAQDRSVAAWTENIVLAAHAVPPKTRRPQAAKSAVALVVKKETQKKAAVASYFT